ncbi:MAG: ABC transporter substrate-binding protein [Curvibacter sp.]|jgi:branched-chain amino acid transport system substrate-binding protein|nr:ABC transporter substrate-binding protein [Curvibacter sp.]
MQHRRRFLTLALLVLGWAAPAWSQKPPPLRIGLIGPFTGPSADFGTPMLQGAQLAVDEINAVGGYLGRKIELVVKDDTANPDIGLQRSQELAREGVVATIGFCNTGVALKALDVYQNARIPLIVPCSTGTPVTAKFPAPESYIFRTSARDAIQAPFIVDDIVNRGWSKVAVFADKTGYGEAGLQDVLKALESKKLKPVHIARFDLGVKDLSAELKAAQAAGANVILSYTVGPENAVIARSRQALGWKVTQVGAWPLSFPFFIEGAKGAAEGSLMSQTFIAEPSNERRASFLRAYFRKYSTDKITVPMSAAQAYDTVYILTYALFGVRDGDLSGPSVKFALENMSRVYYGVTATHERPFSNDDKDAITANMLVMGMVRNGAVTFAYPEDRTRNLFVQRKQR